MDNRDAIKKLTNLLSKEGFVIDGITKEVDKDYIIFWHNTPTNTQLEIANEIIRNLDPCTYSIECDNKFIGADGIDSAVVKIRSSGYSDTITVNGQDVVVGLDKNGYGEYEVTASSPMDIDIVGKEGELAEYSTTVFAR